MSDTDAKNKCACSLLRMTTRAVTNYFAMFIDDKEITSQQFTMLVLIHKNGSLCINDIADTLIMDQTTVTRNINVLQKHGFISIKKDKHDARKRIISLTPKAFSKVENILPKWIDAQAQIENHVGSERYRAFLEVLADIETFIKYFKL